MRPLRVNMRPSRHIGPTAKQLYSLGMHGSQHGCEHLVHFISKEDSDSKVRLDNHWEGVLAVPKTHQRQFYSKRD